jgi:hypothetical protein
MTHNPSGRCPAHPLTGPVPAPGNPPAPAPAPAPPAAVIATIDHEDADLLGRLAESIGRRLAQAVFDDEEQQFFDDVADGLTVNHDATAIATLLQACVQGLVNLRMEEQEIRDIMSDMLR